MASPKKNSKTNNKNKKNNDTCFTIMPFGGWFDNYYETIYKPAIETAGLTPTRADDIYRPGTIVNDIWTYTKNSKIVLADLTDKNPNVFYELGLAHALAKPAILIAGTINDVPFDLRALRVIEFDKNLPEWDKYLKERITASITEIVKSPLESVLPAFLNIKESKQETSVTEYEKEMIEIKQNIELLQRQISRQSDERTFEPSEATTYIDDMVRKGAPDSFILNHLSRRGVPTGWARRRIEEAHYKMQPHPVYKPIAKPSASQSRRTKAAQNKAQPKKSQSKDE